MATDRASRASMDHWGLRSRGAGQDRGRRAAIMKEAERKTAGMEETLKQAALNPAINPEMTWANVDMVNDGDGGFKPMQSIEEALQYGDARVARLTKTPKAGTPKPDAKTRDAREGTGERIGDTIVGQLPLGMCEPDGTYFNPRDPKTGRGKVYAKGSKAGEPIMLPRYRAKDMDQAVRYFEAFVAFQAQLLPGGQESIHCYSLQFDEGRPHVQMLCDVFEDDISKKNPQGLKSGYQRAFGSHRSDLLVQSTDRRTGTPLFDEHGDPKMVREAGSRKMSRYHEELREHMLALGYDIESEIDVDRHMRRLDHADYQALLDAQAEHEDVVAEDLAFVAATASEIEDHRDAVVDALVNAHEAAAEVRRDEIELSMRETNFGEEAAAIRLALDDRVAEIDAATVARTAQLDQREAALDELAAEIPRLRAAAVDEGRAEGREAGRAEVRQELDAALVASDAAERARVAAAEHERRQQEAADRAEADRGAAADDRRAAAAERQAISETLDRVDDLASRAERWAAYDHAKVTEAIPDPHMREALAMIPAYEQTPQGFVRGPDGKPVQSTALDVAGQLAPALAERDRQAAAQVRRAGRDVRAELERRANGGSLDDARARIEAGEQTMARQDRERGPDQSHGLDR